MNKPSPWKSNELPESLERVGMSLEPLRLTGRGRQTAQGFTKGEAFIKPVLLLALDNRDHVDTEEVMKEYHLSAADMDELVHKMIDEGLINVPRWYERGS